MKRIFACAILALFAIAAHADAKRVKVFTIGNSFSQSAFRYLAQVVNSLDGCEVEFDGAILGGCTLKRHWENIEKEESSPETKFYKNKKASMRELLQSRKWDVVTIQQASHDSWRPETYQPYADNIVAYVKKHAPQAKIVIQQTWSYRADAPQLKKWGIDQTEMFAKLEKNYRELSEHFAAEVIPTGLAVQIARRSQPEDCSIFSKEALESLPEGKSPKQSNFVVGATWRQKGGAFKTDYIHLNQRGQYMQSCVWAGFLFGKDPEEISYKPDSMAQSDAEFLRECASKALKEYKQTGIAPGK